MNPTQKQFSLTGVSLNKGNSYQFFLLLLLGFSSFHGFAADLAEWTVIIFMNGDNNLEEDAIIDFLEIGHTGSSDKVNVVVQFDRGVGAGGFGDWTNTARFYMTKGIKPYLTNAVENMAEQDMGDPAVLADFVTWAQGRYPAKRYILDIWNHGQGWRAFMRTAAYRASAMKLMSSQHDWSAMANLPLGLLQAIPPASTPTKSVSSDKTSHSVLYNRAIQNVLAGKQLDVIGFDACLMGMVETAYAMRGVASVMVASEEMEPGTGWRYDDWLNELEAKPAMDSRALGSLLVESYRRTSSQIYDYTTTTLSAVDLSQSEALCNSISKLADELKDALKQSGKAIIAARTACLVYAPKTFPPSPRDYFQHIDLGHFCDELQSRNISPKIGLAAGEVRQALNNTVFADYAGSQRQGAFGSTGLAIYFPLTANLYKTDPYEEGGYQKVNGKVPANVKFPVEFVEKHRWADFLQEYFKYN